MDDKQAQRKPRGTGQATPRHGRKLPAGDLDRVAAADGMSDASNQIEFFSR